MKVNLIISKRPEKTWVHYDIEICDLDGKNLKYDYSEHYGCFTPPYPAHKIKDKFNPNLSLKKICKRIFLKEAGVDNSKFYLTYEHHENKNPIEVNEIKILNGRNKIKFELKEE